MSTYKDGMAIPFSGHASMFVAMSIALRFARETPPVQQLIDAFGMCRATAYRWRSAIKAAKGEP